MINDTEKVTLFITGMTCAACSTRLEKVLNKQPSVQATVNLATEQAHILYTQEVYPNREILLQALIKRVEQAGFSATEYSEAANWTEQEQNTDTTITQQKERNEIGLSLLLCLPFWVQMVAMFTMDVMWFAPWVEAILAFPVQFYFGRRFHSGAYRTLKGGGANMDVLVSLGTNISYFYSLYFVWLDPNGHHALYFEASVTVISLVLLGKYLENRAKRQTQAALSELVALQPKTARVFIHQKWQEIPVVQVQLNDLCLIRQGEAVPVDGTIRHGTIQCNEQFLTGEALPVLKTVGDTVLSGSLLVEGTAQINATQIGKKTVLAQMVQLVAEAQGSKAPIQRLADKISGIFVPIVIGLSLLTFLGWWWFGQSSAHGLQNALAVLVIACPCALGLATPTAMMVATGLGAKHGLIAHNAAALEQAAQLQVLFLDKTGTLTQGQPEVKQCVFFNHDQTPAQLLDWCAQLEQQSPHPLAQAIVSYVKKTNPDWQAHLTQVMHFKSEIGKGIEGTIEQHTFCLGAPHWLKTWIPFSEALETFLDTCQQQGETVILCANRETKQVLVAFSLADTIRPESAAAIQALLALGVRPIMLTGDQDSPAQAVARQVGIETVFAQVTPQEKYTHIQKMQQQGYIVGMVGDGMNDAAALTQAHVSFAMGGGTDIASQNADITLMTNDLMRLSATIRLSKKTLHIIRQNLFFAFVYNTIGIFLAMMGIFNPTIAGAAMAMSSISVVSNSLRLKKNAFH